MTLGCQGGPVSTCDRPEIRRMQGAGVGVGVGRGGEGRPGAATPGQLLLCPTPPCLHPLPTTRSRQREGPGSSPHGARFNL